MYADGRVEETAHELLGATFIVFENVDGAHWQREFKMVCAVRSTAEDPASERGPYTMVAVERSFHLVRTAKQVRDDDERHRWELMQRVLRGLRDE